MLKPQLTPQKHKAIYAQFIQFVASDLSWLPATAVANL